MTAASHYRKRFGPAVACARKAHYDTWVEAEHVARQYNGVSDNIVMAYRCSTIAAPDADLKYMELQQEVAEIRRYQDAQAIREEAMIDLINTMRDVWIAASGDVGWMPKEHVFRLLLNKYDPEIVEYAIDEVAGKLSTGYVFKGNGWLPYLYAVARNMAEGD